MTIQGIFLEGFNKNNQNVRYFVTLKEQPFVFSLKWSNYCQTAFLSIKDDEDNDIISGRALTNNLKIRNNKLPFTLCFVQIDGKTYEPTLNNISSDFVLAYDDGE